MLFSCASTTLGYDNVSHGCISLSPEDAEWHFNTVNVGDPATIRCAREPLQFDQRSVTLRLRRSNQCPIVSRCVVAGGARR